MVIAGNSYYWQAMLAIRLAGAKGDITGTDRVAWKLNRLTPYVSSPLLYDDTLYFLRHNQNILPASNPRPASRAANRSGSKAFAIHLRFARRRRRTHLHHRPRRGHGRPAPRSRKRPAGGQPPRRLFSASPALVDHELYLRGEHFLYCVAED